MNHVAGEGVGMKNGKLHEKNRKTHTHIYIYTLVYSPYTTAAENKQKETY